MNPSKTRERVVLLMGSLIYGGFFGLGLWLESFSERSVAFALLLIPPGVLLSALALSGLFRLSKRRAQRASAREERPFHAARAFGLILLCYAPMWLVTFPGSFAYDVPFQLKQVFTGAYSTHHPLLHTLLLGGCVALGRALGSVNLGAALYTLVQMSLLALCFALCCASIARQAGARAARLCAVYFALYPLHMLFAVNATKDVLFSGAFALTLALSFEAAGCDRPSKGLLAGLAGCGALMMLLRNNALYAAAVWAVPLLVFLRRRPMLPLAAGLSVALALGGGSLLKSATRAQSGDLCEMLSVPIQMLARARLFESERLSEEEKEEIDALMPGEAWRLYDPTISDPVKFEFDTAALMENPRAALETTLSVLQKCPETCARAFLELTSPFWYPYRTYRVSGYYLQMGIGEQFYDWCDFERIHSASFAPRVLASLSWRVGAKGAAQIPVVGALFNMGFVVWVMLYFVLREMYLGRWWRFAVALLPVLLWGTFLLGPVMAGRYAYVFYCALPALAVNREE